MEETKYTLVRVEGEYAYLRKDGASPADDLFIAMALLPPSVDEGSRLLYENFEFSLID